MEAHACIAELKAALEKLYDTPIEKQRKALLKGESRFTHGKLSDVFRSLVDPRLDKHERDMLDEGTSSCRTWVLSLVASSRVVLKAHRFVIGKQVGETSSGSDSRMRTYF